MVIHVQLSVQAWDAEKAEAQAIVLENPTGVAAAVADIHLAAVQGAVDDAANQSATSPVASLSDLPNTEVNGVNPSPSLPPPVNPKPLRSQSHTPKPGTWLPRLILPTM